MRFAERGSKITPQSNFSVNVSVLYAFAELLLYNERQRERIQGAGEL